MTGDEVWKEKIEEWRENEVKIYENKREEKDIKRDRTEGRKR